MKFLLKALCLLCILAKYNNLAAQEGKIDSSAIKTLRIDPQSARGAAVSQFFDDVKFVPLETTKESLFGTISQFKVVENHYLIYDYDTKALFIFDLDGKFKAKIDANKLESSKEDKQKAQLYGFTLVKNKTEQFIAIFTPNGVQLFDLKGKFIKKADKSLNYNNDIKFATGDVSVRQGFLVKKEKDSTYYNVGMFKNNAKDSIGYFKIDDRKYQKDDWWGTAGLFKYSPNEAFFIDHYDYNLYRVSPNKVSLAYQLIFPAQNSLPKDFRTNPIYVKKRQEYFEKNNRVFYGLASAYQFNDWLYLKMYSYYWDKDQKRNLIYNVNSGETVSFQDLEPDSLSSFLPVTDAGYSYEFENRGFLAFENDYFYTSYSSLAMQTFKERSAGKTTNYPPLLTQYFKTSDRKSNPILILLKPKKNI